jgi:hypothetical protein
MRTNSILAAAAAALLSASAWSQNCANTSTGKIPLNDLGAGSYLGFQGGLYPLGSNLRPIAHEVGGLKLAQQVVARDAAGNPDPIAGRVGFISIGMSNCVQHFNAFMALSNADPLRSARVQLVNCAQGGQTASEIADPNHPYWTHVANQIAQAGLTPAQVQVVWFLEANANPTGGFPGQALTLQSQFAAIMNNITDKYPAVRLVYSASRIYAGYSTTGLNPEPYAYEQAFAVKWMIEQQISGHPALNYEPSLGPVESPWLAWGPYMWADGLIPRSDRLIWQCSDFQPDGTHPSASGTAKVASALLSFVQTDSTARGWYLARPTPVTYGTGKLTSIGTTPACGWIGDPDVGTNAFQIRMTGGVPGQTVIGVYSANPAQAPFLGGTLWLGLPVTRLAPKLLDGAGSVSYDIPLLPVMLGTSRDYSFWFRDGAHPDGTGAGLANGLAVRFFD